MIVKFNFHTNMSFFRSYVETFFLRWPPNGHIVYRIMPNFEPHLALGKIYQPTKFHENPLRRSKVIVRKPLIEVVAMATVSVQLLKLFLLCIILGLYNNDWKSYGHKFL